ncbi:hypothetical protein LCGC14_1210060 [marine sediment metagenome]|uniref:Band 7 domain-containing protein n=1 Tax=marine sediment metagenome TaxID=412755 RepID=A0A0F9LEA7_9ZZZZ
MSKKLTGKSVIAMVLGAVALVMCLVIPFACTTTVGAEEIVIHQSVLGDLTVWTEPGWKYQGLGTITRYKRSSQFDFSAPHDESQAKSEEGKKTAQQDNSIPVRFNDQGQAHISGSLSYDLPLDRDAMLKIHKKFGSMEAIEDRLVRQTVTRSVYFSGPLMSSRESAGQRRGELIHFIIEQATRGVYQTESKKVEVEDLLSPPVETVKMVTVPVMNEETGKPALDENNQPVMKQEPRKISKPATKTVLIVTPMVGGDGKILVQEASALTSLGLKMYNLTVNRILYEGKVKEQIDMQRQAIMDIQTKIAEGKAAEQRRVTVEKEGQADAAKAKWAQEVLKSTAITEAQQKKAVAIEQAEQKRAVAEKDLDSAKLERKAKVERALGDAKAKKLIMAADGALEKKLAAYVAIQQAWASSIGSQPLVPQVQMGGGGTNNQGLNLMQLLTAKVAKDLALDAGMGRK